MPSLPPRVRGSEPLTRFHLLHRVKDKAQPSLHGITTLLPGKPTKKVGCQGYTMGDCREQEEGSPSSEKAGGDAVNFLPTAGSRLT